jgi:hypothetical protein
MNSQEPVWEVNIDGKVYETELETLKRWIAEGRVLATDQVRKGSLSWLAANRVPALRGLFPETGPSQQNSPASPQAETPLPLAPPSDTVVNHDSFDLETGPGKAPFPHSASTCHNHPDRSPIYSCRMCGKTFCSDCPQFVSSSRIPTCPSCGDLCVPIDEAEVEQTKAGFTREVEPASVIRITSPFGLSDFGRALQYPLRRPLGLVGISAFYGFLQLGGFKTQLLAFALLFGCLALVIKQVAWGRSERSFIPEFNDFSFADDVLGPAVLGLGATIVTFGPFLMLMLAMLSGWIGGSSPAVADSPQAQTEAGKSTLTGDDLNALVNSESSEKDQAAMKKLRQLQPAAQADEYVKEQTPGPETSSMMELIRPILNQTGSVATLGLFTLGWALVYYPMALAVAGYSEDFWSVINPMVGLDTMRRMGLVYAKAFFMYLGVQGTGFAIGIFVAALTAPLTLPLLGNLPGKILNSIVTFYCSLAVAYILGMALHKCARQLNIPTD